MNVLKKKINYGKRFIILMLLVNFIVLSFCYSYALFVTKQLQDNIKQTMKNTADLEVSSVVITVKNIVSKKVKEEKNLVKKEESIEKE